MRKSNESVRSCRTATALARWCAALPAATYGVRLIVADGGGLVQSRQVTADGLSRAAGWLRHVNAKGANVFGRPLCSNHVLIDDLDNDSLATLMRRHRVAVVVESSPYNFQAWVTVSDHPLSPRLASGAARIFARHFGGDPGAAAWCQYSRLPGLTNRKAIHERGDGTYPWALLRQASAGVDPASGAILEEAATALAEAGRGADGQRPCGLRRLALTPRDVADEHAAAGAWVVASLPPGTPVDRSRLDHAIARRLISRGVDAGHAEAVVAAGSRATDLGQGAAVAYARRTVAVAMRGRVRLDAPG